MGAHGILSLGRDRGYSTHLVPYPGSIGRVRNRYANKRVLVVGGGHFAFNALQDLVRLTQEAPQTKARCCLLQ